MIVVALVVGLVAATWLIGGLRGPRRSRSSAQSQSVSVIVPARNEATTLPTLLDSLGCLDPAPFEIIVIDDESDDDTADVARRHGATTVVRTTPGSGWLGKTWACHTGANAASGRLLLFLDADTWLAPNALDALVAKHDERGGLVSVQPYHVTEEPYEELSAYCSAVAMLGSGAFSVGRASRTAVAFGPCLLTSAQDYERVGGHAAVRYEVVEDVRLARRYRAAELPVVCLAGRDAVSFRMYPGGIGQLVEGWSKNVAAGAAAASPVAVIATIVWVASHAALVSAAVLSTSRWFRGVSGFPGLIVACWVVVAAHQFWLLRRIGSFRWWTAVAFPIPLAAFFWIFARSCVMTWLRREVTWRGRRIRLPARTGR